MMKKTFVIALAALVAGAFFAPVEAAKKKKKETKQPGQEMMAPVQLATSSDSLSYVAGMMMTNGLFDYLRQQLKVDTAYMADFVRGFNETARVSDDPHEMALRAGRQIAEQVRNNMLPRMKQDFSDTPDSIVEAALFRGFADALMHDTTVFKVDAADQLFKQKHQENQAARAARLSQAGRDFLAQNGTKEGVITTASGLQYKILVKGEGDIPQPTDKVKVHYEGRLIDGTVFDASSKHGNEPASFRADQVIRGWTEALTMMPVGSKWQLYIPQELGYGERQVGQIPAYATLIFDVELVDIEK